MIKSYGNRFVGTETTVQIKNFNDTFPINETFSKEIILSNIISWILLYGFKHNYIVRLGFFYHQSSTSFFFLKLLGIGMF